jgi:hypothetical protein
MRALPYVSAALAAFLTMMLARPELAAEVALFVYFPILILTDGTNCFLNRDRFEGAVAQE